ncbi:hypothetical protein lbkm_1974 [Lachnospiraceae bacterium KM106-2]|nr:hypothetical protein lbkm_1974 [Lachnospiraceae bacterium KM106-2]
MKPIQRWLPYSIIFLMIFYGLPLLTGMNQSVTDLLLQLYTPCLCMILGVVYGIKEEFNFSFCLLGAILFLPTIWIFYEVTTWIYAVVYFLMIFIGMLPGLIKEIEEQ